MKFRNLFLLLLLITQTRSYSQQIFNTPPGGSLRTMAEWEEVQALVVTWRDYKTVLAAIIANAQEDAMVIVHYPTNTNEQAVRNELMNTYGVALGTNVVFRRQPANSLWIRDYGANSVYLNNVDSLILVDWRYNRPRPSDDTLPRSYARYLNLPLYQTTAAPNLLVHTGGNFMSDGFGQGFSSDLIIDENPTLSETQIDNNMNSFMGISEYIKMIKLPYDGIHHIDMHMKLLDEETLLMGQYPEGISDGPQIEANLLYVLDNFTSVFGTPYRVVRMEMPPDSLNRYPNQNGHYRTFTNSVFINKTLLVPTYAPQYDTTALRIYRENLPGYNVVGINCKSIIPAGGAIHCITHSVGVNDPLLISHQPLTDTYEMNEPYRVDARILHRSGIAEAKLWYRLDQQSNFEEVAMTLTDSESDTWTGFIPGTLQVARVHYYIQGFANSGKQQVRPITAPEGSWKFNVLDTNDITTRTRLIERVFEMAIFPNPASSITCIPVTMDASASVELSLLDISGRSIQVLHNGMLSSGENRFYLDASQYESGVYFIRAVTNFGSRVQKLIIN